MEPCPFCKGLGALKRDLAKNHGESDRYVVRCRKCGCEGPWAATGPKAIDLWNDRHCLCKKEITTENI